MRIAGCRQIVFYILRCRSEFVLYIVFDGCELVHYILVGFLRVLGKVYGFLLNRTCQLLSALTKG
ncbi:hypothetical protein D3C71_2134090 [compost metagenome]